MVKKITSRQLCLLLCISVISLKFLFFPAIVSLYAKNDSYISVFLGLLIDMVVVLLIVYTMKHFSNMSFKEILVNNVGKIAFYVMYTLIFFYLILKALLVVKEVHHYFLEFLYEDFSWIWFTIPIIVLLMYVCVKGMQAVARSVEMLFVVISVGIVVTLLIPMGSINLEYLQPFFTHPTGVVQGLFHSVIAYGDWLIVLLLMGKVKLNEKSGRNIILTCLVVYVFVVLFIVEYVGLFKNIGIYKPYAFSDMPLYTDLPNNSARIDWLSSIIWTFDLMLQVCILMSLASVTLKDMFPKIKPHFCSVICIIPLFAGMVVFYLNLGRLLKVVTSVWCSAVILGFHVLIPLVLVMCIVIDSVKKRKVVEVQNAKKVNQK